MNFRVSNSLRAHRRKVGDESRLLLRTCVRRSVPVIQMHLGEQRYRFSRNKLQTYVRPHISEQAIVTHPKRVFDVISAWEPTIDSRRRANIWRNQQGKRKHTVRQKGVRFPSLHSFREPRSSRRRALTLHPPRPCRYHMSGSVPFGGDNTPALDSARVESDSPSPPAVRR